MSTAISTGTAAVNGVSLAVREWGEGEPALLLLHGYMGSGLDWVDVAPALAVGHRVVAYDHRGHGGSSHPTGAGAYTFAALAADLAAFIRLSALGPVDLLGHSMGGVVAMMHTLAHPQTVRSLVLMDTAAEPAGNVPMDLLGPLVAMGREQGMDALANVVADFALTLPVREGQSQEVVRERAVAKTRALDIEAIAALGDELVRYTSMVDLLPDIACSVTVIVGETDEALRDSADTMARLIPGAELVVVAGAGHSPQEDRPGEWTNAVLAHLDRVNTRGVDER